jgi:predicted Fe-Mo cluster-binding NifX family protein
LILSAGGVRVGLGVEGTVAEAIERLRRGEIVAAEQADVEGHWVEG